MDITKRNIKIIIVLADSISGYSFSLYFWISFDLCMYLFVYFKLSQVLGHSGVKMDVEVPVD
jgi:hypothetical protein